MNKAKNIYRVIYISLGLLVAVLIIFISTSAWSHRGMCPTSDEIEKLRVEAANDNAEQGFFAGAAKEKYEVAKSCSQPDEDNRAIGNAVGASTIVVITYIVLLLVIINVKSKVKFSVDKENYKHLESLALWRFSKVIFWITLPLIVAYLLFIAKDSFVWGVMGALISFPLYLVFKRLALYVASGKK